MDGAARCLWGLRAAAAAILVALAAVPFEWLNQAPGLCLFRSLLGFECLGCGMTRALVRLLNGDLEAALQWNQGVVPALGLIVAFILWGGRLAPQRPA